MNPVRRFLLQMLAALPVVGTGLFKTEAAEAAEAFKAAKMAASESRALMIADHNRRYLAGHNYVYSDRHQKFYPNLFVYMTELHSEQFLTLVVEGKGADEIHEMLGTQYRGDVLFALLICYFGKRDGMPMFQDTAIEPPQELAENYEKFEDIWRRRHDPPPPPPPPPEPAPWRPRFAESIEAEIEYLRALRERNPDWVNLIDRMMARSQDELAKRLALVAERG